MTHKETAVFSLPTSESTRRSLLDAPLHEALASVEKLAA